MKKRYPFFNVSNLQERMAFLMNRILSNELNFFAQELRDYLSPAVLQNIAKRVSFVKRKSKYQANELIALCIWLSQVINSSSLQRRLEA